MNPKVLWTGHDQPMDTIGEAVEVEGGGATLSLCVRCGTRVASHPGQQPCRPVLLKAGVWYVFWPDKGTRPAAELSEQETNELRAFWRPGLPWELVKQRRRA